MEPFFDFIVAIGNTRLDTDNDTFRDLLKGEPDQQYEWGREWLKKRRVV